MRLLLDEMWAPYVAVALQRRGHDVVAVAARRELRGKPDPVIVQAALREDRALVTADIGDYRAMAAVAAAAGDPYPALVLTDPRIWYPARVRDRAGGRLVNALDALLSSGETIEGERWLVPVD